MITVLHMGGPRNEYSVPKSWGITLRVSSLKKNQISFLIDIKMITLLILGEVGQTENSIYVGFCQNDYNITKGEVSRDLQK